MKRNSGEILLIILFVGAIAVTIGGVMILKKSQEQKEDSNDDLNETRELTISETKFPEKTNKSGLTQTQQTPAISKAISTPKVENNSKLSTRFTSLGIKTIEDGATAQITYAKETEKEINIHIIFANPTSTDKKVGPLRTSMRSAKYGYSPEPAPSPLTLSPGQKREFDFSYFPEDSPPFKFYYSNFGSGEIELGGYK